MGDGMGDQQVAFADIQRSRPGQLELFDGLLTGTHAYTQSFAVYDLAPKHVYRTEEREAGKYLPVMHRTFRYADREYILEIRPARVVRDGAEIEVYPGEREQMVEEALRRIAIERRRTQLYDGSAGVYFTLYELRKELDRVGHGLPLAEIKEAVEVAHLSNVKIAVAGGETLVSASIFPIRGLNEQTEEGDTVSFVTFNPLVTEAILRLDFRLLNYETSMRLTSSVARWLHKRLSHCYTQASIADGGGYNINATTIMRDSGMGSYKQSRDAFRTIERAITELKSKKILIAYTADAKRGVRGRLEEVTYTLRPSPDFCTEQKKANHMAQQVVQLADQRGIEHAKSRRPALPPGPGARPMLGRSIPVRTG